MVLIMQLFQGSYGQVCAVSFVNSEIECFFIFLGGVFGYLVGCLVFDIKCFLVVGISWKFLLFFSFFIFFFRMVLFCFWHSEFWIRAEAKLELCAFSFLFMEARFSVLPFLILFIMLMLPLSCCIESFQLVFYIIVFGIFFLFFNILKLAFPREILSAFL